MQASLLEILRSIPGHRRAEGKRFDLTTVLLYAILGMVAGANSYQQMHEFIRVHLQRLNEAFGLRLPYSPSYTGLLLIIQGVDPAALEAAFRQHASSISAPPPSDSLVATAVDGKTLRGSFDAFSDRKAAHMMSALRQADQIVLGHLIVEEKSNEIPAAPEPIEALGLKGCVFTLDAERARRQYHAVEPENRLVARTLELLREEKLRAAEAIEKEYEQWGLEEPLVLSDADRAALLALGENLPGIWRAATTTAADRKRILRFMIREVALYQKRVRGQVAIRILWQTGTVSERAMRRCVHVYHECDDLETLRRRVSELNRSGKMDKEIAATLNHEGFVGARGWLFQGENVWLPTSVRENVGLNFDKRLIY
ncbi:MAG: ISAs1 family transposase [Roseiarcus sp.]|jgi:predicted transposase YbfD/YdcC